VGASFFDGIFQGLGYTGVLMIMCMFREFFGKGSFGGGLQHRERRHRHGNGSGVQIFPAKYPPLILTLPVGGFLCLGCLIALMQFARKSAKRRKLGCCVKEAAKMTFTGLLSISLGAILINNFIFSQFLGCCPFLGVSNKMDTASRHGHRRYLRHGPRLGASAGSSMLHPDQAGRSCRR
jgi:Na+-translocating ferredoxin:NAD+ oxidoreductase RnfE subunit